MKIVHFGSNYKKALEDIRKYSKISYLIVLLIAIFSLSVGYFFYLVRIEKNEIYLLVRLNGESTAVPYWIANSVNIGDKDADPYGNVRALVVDKETYEGGGDGLFVQLILKVYTIKDKSGLYLFKNQPLSVGGKINLNFPKISQEAYIFSMEENPPKEAYKTLLVELETSSISDDLIDLINEEDKVTDSKGRILVKILRKGVENAPIRGDDKIMKLSAEILTKKISNYFYFQENQKVKVGEVIDLHLNDVSLWDLKVTSVSEV